VTAFEPTHTAGRSMMSAQRLSGLCMRFLPCSLEAI